ncbi:enoyl-CoA hydratase/isomerase family protein [Pusillimonas sp. ANT_WB101]|uniref:enoyl-CoA hydratase/isomerase family protein n=1 Tax=Pusillimonas sp. ANT_WB101 TaxID=2597356 RepID=UPI0011ED9696|nr:enoyl-CoA hydratase/isomerase family protein [Pusillimonas sp. ANT_WB101]KAA0889302.1 enoyl-CoA hydratase/isomerase family protein [Pusillimonas sp. ANT_WB101]
MTTENQEEIVVETIGQVAVVTYNRGGRRNALSLKAIKELTRIAESFQDNADVSCVILTGTKSEFSAGVDLKDPERWTVDHLSLDELRILSSWGPRMCKAWEEIPQITIAAIEGLIIGGGVALAVSCDWRVAARSSYFLVPEAQIGIPLGWQTIPRLNTLVGGSRAKQIILLGDKVDSQTALDWGLADWVVDDGEARNTALALAEKLGRTTGVIVKMTKKAVNAHNHALNHLSSHMDLDQLLMCSQGNEARATRAQFQK